MKVLTKRSTNTAETLAGVVIVQTMDAVPHVGVFWIVSKVNGELSVGVGLGDPMASVGEVENERAVDDGD